MSASVKMIGCGGLARLEPRGKSGLRVIRARVDMRISPLRGQGRIFFGEMLGLGPFRASRGEGGVSIDQ